jgi:lichenan operon transcriptional antiterminator
MLFAYSRLNIIFNLLRLRTSPLSAEKLTSELNISARTLRTDITNLNSTLEKYGATIDRKRNLGYWLHIKDRSAFSALYQTNEPQVLVPLEFDTPEQRIKFMLRKLLYNKAPIRAEDFAKQFCISINSIIAYLKNIKQIITPYDLQLQNSTSQGLHIIGNETSVRRCMSDYVIERNFENYLLGFTPEERSIFKDIDIIPLPKIIRKYLQNIPARFSDFSLKNFMIHLAIMLSRLQNNYEISISEIQPEKNMTIYQQFVQPIIDELKKAYPYSFNEAEQQYIYDHFILNAHLPQLKEAQQEQEITDYLDKLLQNIFHHYNFDLQSDAVLRQDLFLHLTSIWPMRNCNTARENPLVTTIKKAYPLAYEITFSSLPLKTNGESFLSEKEIPYISLHIGAALERFFTTQTKKKRAVIICGSGRATSRMLEAGITNVFQSKVYIAGCLSYQQYLHYDISSLDFAISTIPIENRGIPVIQVNFPLAHDDIRLLSQNLTEIDSRQELLHTFFHKDTFLKLTHCEKKEKLLTEMCQKLYIGNYIDENFLSSVLYREHIAPTNVNHMLAIAHPMELSAKKTTVCTAILEKPLLWHKEHNLSIQIVLLLAIKREDYCHINALYNIILQMISNNKLSQQLLNCKGAEPFSQFIKILQLQEKETTTDFSQH